jgi:autophagy-related protein 18
MKKSPMKRSSSKGDVFTTDPILYSSFNQNGTYLSCCLATGFKIFSLKPFKLECELNIGGVAIVEMLYQSGVVAIVGGGESPAFDPTKVVLYDYKEGKSIGEIQCTKPIKSVKLHVNLYVHFSNLE